MSPPPRDISEVIDRVIGELPPEETALIAELRRIQYGATFTAPELMGLRWQDATDALIAFAMNKPWSPVVASIWAGKS